MGRPIKRICRPCHAARLRGDLAEVFRRHCRGKQMALPGIDGEME
jgi:hypothetical protein